MVYTYYYKKYKAPNYTAYAVLYLQYSLSLPLYIKLYIVRAVRTVCIDCRLYVDCIMTRSALLSTFLCISVQFYYAADNTILYIGHAVYYIVFCFLYCTL